MLWLAATSVPVAFSAVLTFGCCALPFHRAIHRLVRCGQMIRVAVGVDQRDAPSTPAKQPTKAQRAITAVARALQPPRIQPAAVDADAADGVRNTISFGALRVDDDIGLRALLATFLI